MKIVIAEKPSVGASIAQVLGARTRKDGYFEGAGYQVSWAVGHLVETAQPEVINPSWKRWSLDDLPLIPTEWPLSLRKEAQDQFKVLKKLLRAKASREVICATDAGREGEHIFRLIYRLTECKLPFSRLWISSLTDESIKRGFANLRPGSEFDGLADAAEGRDKADWMVGLTLTRLYTLLADSGATANAKSSTGGKSEVWSVGRVQTPTLALVVARDLQRKKFARTPYRQVRASFGDVRALFHRKVANPETGEQELSAELPSPLNTKFLLPTDDAAAIAERVRSTGVARVGEMQRKPKKEPSPLLHDLSALQQEANTLWGWPAAKTLEVAQRLYQEHKVLSYPRTGSRYLDEDTASSLPEIFRAVSAPFRELLPPEAGTAKLGKRFVDGAKVGDHHALIPTGRTSARPLPGDDAALYELVLRRFCQMWAPIAESESVRAEVVVQTGHVEDLFIVRATRMVAPGWKALEPKVAACGKTSDDDDEAQGLPDSFQSGATMAVSNVEVLDKTKNPPPAYTEASLLKAMETAGKRIEDPELAAAMKEMGLGTPATRAGVIDSLVDRGYVEREGKSLLATAKGTGLIARVHPCVRTPQITGEWERRLEQIAQGRESLQAFLADVAEYLREVVGDAIRRQQ